MSVGVDSWEPLHVEEVGELFTEASFKWWISGGHALDLYLGGRGRQHDDLDVGICRHQAPAVHTWLREWDLWVAAAGALSSWKGRPLKIEKDENNVWARRSPQHPWAFDLAVNECTEDEWVYRRDPSVVRRWQAAVLEGPSGIPYLAPELQLLFKSERLRSKDHDDARRVIPAMGHQRRVWLSDHLGPDHPWQEMIRGTDGA
jgi:hypothetical protein